MAEENNIVRLKNTLKAPSVKAKFEEMLGNRASQFMTSITTVVQNNALLQKADVNSIIMGAAIAASMDLPLHPSLGYAALVPYNSKDGCFAQFQIMVGGITELFLRSGKCLKLINEVVYEGQLVSKNKFTGEYVFDESRKVSDKVIGYMAYFKLTNGCEKFEYLTVEEVKTHAQKFSQSYRNGAKIWKDNFDSMGLKTVLRKLLKYAPKSLEMNNAIMFDNHVVEGDITHLDEATVRMDDMTVDEQEQEEVKEFKEAEKKVAKVAKETKKPSANSSFDETTKEDIFDNSEMGFEF